MSDKESLEFDHKTNQAYLRNPEYYAGKDRESKAWEEAEREKKVWTKKEVDELMNTFNNWAKKRGLR